MFITHNFHLQHENISSLSSKIQHLIVKLITAAAKSCLTARAYPGFCCIKKQGLLLLLMDKIIVNQRLPHSSFSDFANNVLLPIYKPGWKEALQGEVTYPRTQRNDSGQGLNRIV